VRFHCDIGTQQHAMATRFAKYMEAMRIMIVMLSCGRDM